MRYPAVLLLTAVVFATPRTLFAQKGSEGGRNVDVPASERPPAGMCRIWLDNVPVAQQPAPTDCASAVRNRPARGRVIFGDDYVTSRRDSGRKAKGSTKGIPPGAPPKIKKP